MSFRYTDYANGLLDPTANALGPVAVLSDTLVLAMLDLTLYTAADSDVSLDDIPSAAIVATVTVTGVTVTGGALGFDPAVFAAMVGAECGAAVLYKDTGTPSTSPLMFYLDDYASGMPVTPNGTNFTWNPAAGGIATF